MGLGYGEGIVDGTRYQTDHSNINGASESDSGSARSRRGSFGRPLKPSNDARTNPSGRRWRRRVSRP